MKKGKAWLRDEVFELYPNYGEMYVSPDYETVVKTETISKVLVLIDQLDEPEKVVIPQFVADWIDTHNLYGNNPLREYRDLENDFNEGWTDEEDAAVYHWVNKNPYAFIDAIRYGYEVEEDKLYTIEFPQAEGGMKMTKLPEWANWLARDEDGVLYAFKSKPLQYEKGTWIPQLSDGTMEYLHIEETDDTFSHIKWTDEEPTSVKALIKEFSDKAESLRELGEALTRNWEAEHGKPSVAEYNQWQITQAKAHGYDEVPTIADKAECVYIDIDVANITVDEPHSISFEDAMRLVENKADDIADKRYEKHRNLVDELHKIYVAKNKDYGNSFGESIDEFGIIAGVVRIGDKYNRLKTLAKGHEPLVNDESMVDTLKDMANYCLLTIIGLEAD